MAETRAVLAGRRCGASGAWWAASTRRPRSHALDSFALVRCARFHGYSIIAPYSIVTGWVNPHGWQVTRVGYGRVHPTVPAPSPHRHTYSRRPSTSRHSAASLRSSSPEPVSFMRVWVASPPIQQSHPQPPELASLSPRLPLTTDDRHQSLHCKE
jgi:hypothetical protein